MTMQDFILLLFVVVVAKISQHISGFYNHWNIFFWKVHLLFWLDEHAQIVILLLSFPYSVI